jgi:hypothetical protein
MTEKGKNILYVVLILTLSFVLYREYTYVIPFNYDWFMGAIFSIIPVESTYSLTWIFLLISAILLSLPLLNKRLIGILGLMFLILVISKPIIVKRTPKESAIEFFQHRKSQMMKIVSKYKATGNVRIMNDEIKNLGFEQFQKDGDTYIFIVHSIIDNSYGFCYDADDNTPTIILGASTTFNKLEFKWYYFTTT